MLYTLGNELMTQSRYSEAIEVYERLFEKHKQLSPDVLLNVFNTLASLYGNRKRIYNIMHDINPLITL
jgi:tetratricopeptide (TPR) repeat protein